MKTSGTIGKLTEALAKAQGLIKGALKDSSNPFFKSKYADLESVWEACREPLSKNGLAIFQGAGDIADGKVVVETILSHTSGEWVSSSFDATPEKLTPQGVGSAITYLRRYGLQSMVGIAPVDDDGEVAEGRQPDKTTPPAKKAKEPKATPPTIDEVIVALTELTPKGFILVQEKVREILKPVYDDKEKAVPSLEKIIKNFQNKYVNEIYVEDTAPY